MNLASNTTTFTDNTVVGGQVYEYKVKAFNLAGETDMPFFKVEIPSCNLDCNGIPNGSAFLDTCGHCVGGNTGKEACTIPNSASDLIVKVVSCDLITLKWKDNSTNEDVFEIRRRESGNQSTATTLDVLAPNTLQYSDSLIEAGKTYEYKVRAINEVGIAGMAWFASAIVPSCTVTGAALASELGSTLEVYPNPFSDVLFFSQNTSWEMLSATGVVLRVGESNTIDTSRLAKGVYFLRIDGQKILKLLRE